MLTRRAIRLGSGLIRKRVARACLLASLLVPGVGAAADLTDLPDISLLSPYAFFGGSFNAHNVQVYGDTAIYNGGGVNVGGASALFGDLYLGTGATAGGESPSGTTTTDLDFSAATTQMFDAATTLASLTGATDYTSITSPTTLGVADGIANVQVFNVDSINLGSGDNITFAGDAGDYYVLNVLDELKTGGDATIGSAEVAPYLLVNLYDQTKDGGSWGEVAKINNEIYGTMFVAYGSATMHSVYGAVYAGADEIKIQSDANLVYQLEGEQTVTTTDGATTFTSPTSFAFIAAESSPSGAVAVSEPGMRWLFATGFIFLVFSSRRRVPWVGWRSIRLADMLRFSHVSQRVNV